MLFFPVFFFHNEGSLLPHSQCSLDTYKKPGHYMNPQEWWKCNIKHCTLHCSRTSEHVDKVIRYCWMIEWLYDYIVYYNVMKPKITAFGYNLYDWLFFIDIELLCWLTLFYFNRWFCVRECVLNTYSVFTSRI